MTTFNKLLLIAFFSSLLGIAKAQTTVSQVISSNQTWTAAGSPYIVSQNVLVKSGVTVKVAPGTRISATGNFSINIESGAGFEAKGTKDSVINIDTVNFEFYKGANGYNFSTGGGSFFSYCFFKGNGLGSLRTFALNETSLLISNCRFWNSYYVFYCINSSTATAKLRLEKSIFEGTKQNYGYVLYTMGNSTELEMDECVVKYTYGLTLCGINTITNCLFYDWVSNSGFRVGYGQSKVTFKCNTFRKFKPTVIEMMGPYASTDVVIVSNTFDSTENHISYSVNTSSPLPKFVCKNNNFLHYNKQSIKLGGGTPGLADTLVFTKNYWGTTSASQIATGIWDINDDIKIGGLVDFAGYQSSLITNCIEDETIEDYIGQTGASINNFNTINFNTYPNPASNLVAIQCTNAALSSYKIYNSTGQLITTGNFKTDTKQIDISTLNNGFYLIEVSDGKNLSAKQKLVVNH